MSKAGTVLKWTYGFTYSTCIRESLHLTKMLKVTSKIPFQSVGP